MEGIVIPASGTHLWRLINIEAMEAYVVSPSLLFGWLLAYQEFFAALAVKSAKATKSTTAQSSDERPRKKHHYITQY